MNSIDVEYYNGGGGASMRAEWDPTGGATFVNIPNSAFYTAAPVNGVLKLGTGTLTLGNTNTYTGGTIVSAGVLQDNGTIGGVTVYGGTLGGSGTAGAVADNANVNPGLGTTTTILNTGDLSFGTGGKLTVALNGTIAGTDYDQLNVTGNIDLTGGILQGSVGYTPAAGDTYTIIHNVNDTPITGMLSTIINNTVVSLPEGAGVVIDGVQFVISYMGGAGNDVTLTRTDNFPTYGDSLGRERQPDDQPVGPLRQRSVEPDALGRRLHVDRWRRPVVRRPARRGAASITGGGTDSISIPSSAVTSITVTLGSGANVFTLNGRTACGRPAQRGYRIDCRRPNQRCLCLSTTADSPRLRPTPSPAAQRSQPCSHSE